jgi:sigma-B regulation protein RsbU (phosphoserine phosphatase)
LFRNIKIGAKILFVVLAVSLVTLAGISAISYTQMLNLEKYSQEADVQLGSTAALDAKNALLRQAREYTQQLVESQAALLDAALRQFPTEAAAGITRMVSALRLGGHGAAFLLDNNFSYIVSPPDGADGFWRDALRAMQTSGPAGVPRLVEAGGEAWYLFAAPLTEAGWTLCVKIPAAEIGKPAEQSKAKIEVDAIQTQSAVRKALSSATAHFLGIFAVFALLVVGFSYGISLTITRPIEALSQNVRKIGEGALDVKVPVTGSDEIAELGNAFNKMTDDLKGYIANIEKASAERERINSELAIAAEIQGNMLPAVSPRFSGNGAFSVFAKMVPAKEVGGDFYDFFYLDKAETKLALVIADVSGKGVPAALFMVVAKTLIKQQMLLSNDPAGTLAAVNALLCEDNPRCMFVTVLLCSIDLATGGMVYANGGHNPPLIAAAGGAFRFMELAKSVPPGMLEASVYRQCSAKLKPGDTLYLYTDGVNEAMNPENEAWGSARFLEAANSALGLEPEAFDAAIRARLAAFTGAAEQSDDITTLAFTYAQKAG